MKVLHLINNLRREGAQMVVRNLVTSTQNGSIQHIVYVREPGGALQQELEAKGVAVFTADKYYGALDTSRSLDLIAQVIKSEAVDLIHAHLSDSACLGWLAARKRSLPLVITYHGHDVLLDCSFLCRTVYYLWLVLASRYTSSNVAVSVSVANCVSRWLFLKPEKIEIVTNGVSVPTDEKVAERLEIKRQHYKVVSVGRLDEPKGHEQLIEAACSLVKNHPGIRFYILGDGPLREQLQEKVVSLGLVDYVIFTGSVDNVSDYLLDCDVYVSASHTEGMPVATLEAMACGIPVIASDIPGNHDIVKHGETGYLYPLGNINDLVESITRVFERYDDAQHCAHTARQMVKENYSNINTAIAYERIYDDSRKT